MVPVDTFQRCCNFFIISMRGVYREGSTLQFHTAQVDVGRSRYGTRYLAIYSGCFLFFSFFRRFRFSWRHPTSNALRIQHPFNTTIRITIQSTGSAAKLCSFGCQLVHVFCRIVATFSNSGLICWQTWVAVYLTTCSKSSIKIIQRTGEVLPIHAMKSLRGSWVEII